jgi:hypothetical protein
MKRGVRTLLLAALVLCAAPVLADAPLAQYAFFDSDDTTINDTKTGLFWDRKPLREKKTFAQVTCPSTYRLPTVKELLTLVDEQPHPEYDTTIAKTVTKAIDQNAFGSYTAEDAPYWSSTPTGTPAEYWGVSFKDGTMARLKVSDVAYPRCVK